MVKDVKRKPCSKSLTPKSARRPVPHNEEIPVPVCSTLPDVSMSEVEEIEDQYSNSSGSEYEVIPSTPQQFSLEELNGLIRDLGLSKQASEHLASRKYDESYLKFGFTWTGSSDEPSPQCVVCSEVLSKNSMKSSLLKRHFESKHGNLVNKDLEYFKRLLEDLHSRKSTIKHFSGADKNEKALKASYKVSHLIAKSGKIHTIGENLILPAALEIVSCMFGEKEAKSIKNIPLSNDTVSRRINDMASNTKEQLVLVIRECPWFGIQIDETTDVAGLAQLIVFVHGIREDKVTNTGNIEKLLQGSSEEKRLTVVAKEAEYKLSLDLIAEYNCPMLLMDHVVKLLVSSIPDSQVVKNINCGRTKATQIFKMLKIEAKNELVQQLKNMNQSSIKDQLLSLVEVENCSADGLTKAIVDLLDKSEINYHNFISFGADNAFVMMGQIAKLKEKSEVIKKNSELFGEEKVDELFDAVQKRYSIYIALDVLNAYSTSKIKIILEENEILLHAYQVIHIFKKKEDLFKIYIDYSVSLLKKPYGENGVLNVLAFQNPSLFLQLFKCDKIVTETLPKATSAGIANITKPEILENPKYGFRYIL
ncbi:unnamed protein product [Psylliodes chrysocephalus]|uniref:Uncharacterized protein n=1 Tax=Psylliodes chrysocephalus TaxID=3402493 RepID=A0A9P0GG20_9CUCU|nr:unnamed protein product [Psylliodes chrysocephala]